LVAPKPSRPNEKHITLNGQVLDENNQPLPGVAVLLQGTTYGTLSDEKGNFQIKFATDAINRTNLILQFQAIGYKVVETTPKTYTDLSIQLEEDVIITQEVVVSASRTSEKAAQATQSIRKINLSTLRDNPTLNPLQLGASEPGVITITTGTLYSTVNLRGFLSSSANRTLLLADGVELMSPDRRSAQGNMAVPPEIDIESIEVASGPSSALYGANAFNGVYSITTRDPFTYPGLGVQFRSGVMLQSNGGADPKPMNDLALRYAHKVNNRLAFKLSIWLQDMADWRANDYTDIGFYDLSSDKTPGINNPGYNAVNVYGDEVRASLDSASTAVPGLGSFLKSPLTIARTGYREEDLRQPQTQLGRVEGAVHYKLSSRHELIIGGRYARANGILQISSDRYSAKDYSTYVGRIELKHSRYFVRGYITGESIGIFNSPTSLSLSILNSYKSHGDWFNQYLWAYNNNAPVLQGIFNSILTANGRAPVRFGNDADARAYADADNSALYPSFYNLFLGFLGDSTQAAAQAAGLTMQSGRPVPGTDKFKEVLNDLTTRPARQGGSNYANSSYMANVEGQYTFAPIGELQFMVGGNARLNRAFSNGNIYNDIADNTISAFAVGAYLQGLWQAMNGRLRVNGAIRLDKVDAIEPALSPRLGISLALGEKRNHVLWTAFSSGVLFPSLQTRFTATRLTEITNVGGDQAIINDYGLGNGNSYNSGSYYSQFLPTYRRTGNYEEAVKLLVSSNLKPISYERVFALDAGYRLNISDKLSIEASAFAAQHLDLITTISVIGPQPRYPLPALTLTPDLLVTEKVQLYFISQNATKKLHTYGLTRYAAYNLTNRLSIATAYTYNGNDFNVYEEQLGAVNFVQIKHSGRVSFIGRNIKERFGFFTTLNLCGEIFGGYNVGIATYLPGYATWDMQVNMKIPKLKSIIRLGGTNLLNQKHRQIIAAPYIGSTYYVQINFDSFLN